MSRVANATWWKPIVQSLTWDSSRRPRDSHNGGVFLGENLITWLVLALGGALVVGNLLALVKPPAHQQDAENLVKAPVTRTLVMAIIGAIAAIWAFVSLVAG